MLILVGLQLQAVLMVKVIGANMFHHPSPNTGNDTWLDPVFRLIGLSCAELLQVNSWKKCPRQGSQCVMFIGQCFRERKTQVRNQHSLLLINMRLELDRNMGKQCPVLTGPYILSFTCGFSSRCLISQPFPRRCAREQSESGSLTPLPFQDHMNGTEGPWGRNAGYIPWT